MKQVNCKLKGVFLGIAETIVGSLLWCGGWGGGGGGGDGYCSAILQCPFSLVLQQLNGDCTCPQHQENTVRRQSEWVRNVHIDLKPTFYKHVTSPFTKKSLLFRCGLLRVDHMWRHAKLIWRLAAYWSVISSVRRASTLPSPPPMSFTTQRKQE